MESVLVILAIILAIALGEIFNINTGLIAGAFAYLIGCFVLGMSVDDLLAAWPTDLFMVIFSISLFFNFAVVNGTLEKVANVLLYRFRNFEKFLPLILYFVTALVSGLGAAFFTSVAVMGAIGMVLCRNSNMNRLYAAMAVSLGALSGANFMVSAHGVLFNSLLSQVDSLADQAATITTNIFAVSFIYPVIVIGVLCFIDMRNNRGKSSDLRIEKPEPFTGKQKLNLALIFIMMLIVLGAPILSNVFSDVTWFVDACDRVDVTLVALVMAIVGYLVKLVDDPKPVFQKVPWDTIWLVGGVGMLVEVAVQAGTIDMLASLINMIPTPLVPIAVCVIAGIMSIFSSTLGVVAPLMFPMIPGFVAATGMSPSLFAVAIIIGAQSTSIAPFSTGGSLQLGSSGLEGEEQDKFYNELLFKGTPLGLIFAAVASVLLMFIF